MNIVNNAFSLSMVPAGMIPDCRRCKASDVPADAASNVGHADTAVLFSKILGRTVNFNRVTHVLGPDDVLYVGQYTGPRLPEGSVTLPEGARIEWWRIAAIPA